MTVVELKEKLISEINNTENEVLLEDILQIIDFERDVQGVYVLSIEEAEAVDEGLEQIKNGHFISNEESNKRAEEWLKKLDGR